MFKDKLQAFTRRSHIVAAVALLFSLLVAGCGDPPPSPEQSIRLWLQQAEQAAEARDFDTLKTLLASDYIDNRGHDRFRARQVLRLLLLRSQSVYLLTRIKDIKILDDDLANVQLAVAMAGTPPPEDLSRMRAEMANFDLALRKSTLSDDWQITQLDWQPAALGDFL